MTSRQSQLIRPLLRLQRVAQRRATIESTRRLSRWTERLFKLPKDVHRERVACSVPAYEWLVPKDVRSDMVILYLHGGGFVLPLYNPTRYVAAHVARSAGMRVLMARYRLAPEHPFPAAVEDCVAAYRWLISERGAAPERVVLAGESAGGNLVVTTMLSLRDAGDPLPAGGACICPACDLAGGGTYYQQDDPMVHPDFVMGMFNAYRAGADVRNPLLSPVHADLQGMPPLMIQIGGAEILRSGAEALAARATADGVSTILEIWPGMWHYWHLLIPHLPEAGQAIESLGRFLHQCEAQD